MKSEFYKKWSKAHVFLLRLYAEETSAQAVRFQAWDVASAASCRSRSVCVARSVPLRLPAARGLGALSAVIKYS